MLWDVPAFRMRYSTIVIPAAQKTLNVQTACHAVREFDHRSIGFAVLVTATVTCGISPF